MENGTVRNSRLTKVMKMMVVEYGGRDGGIGRASARSRKLFESTWVVKPKDLVRECRVTCEFKASLKPNCRLLTANMVRAAASTLSLHWLERRDHVMQHSSP